MGYASDTTKASLTHFCLLWALHQFGKRLQSVSEDQSSDSVTATFEDGSCATGNLIVGADGANSRVRNFLLGDEKAALQDLPLMGICAVDVLPADLSKKIREEYNMLSVLQFAPFGLVAWLARKFI